MLFPFEAATLSSLLYPVGAVSRDSHLIFRLNKSRSRHFLNNYINRNSKADKNHLSLTLETLWLLAYDYT